MCILIRDAYQPVIKEKKEMARHSSSWATKNIFFFFSDTRLIAYVLCQTQILQLVAQPEPTVERPQLIQLAC